MNKLRRFLQVVLLILGVLGLPTGHRGLMATEYSDGYLSTFEMIVIIPGFILCVLLLIAFFIGCMLLIGQFLNWFLKV